MDNRDSCHDQLSSQNTGNMVQHKTQCQLANTNAAAINKTPSSMRGSLDREQLLPSNRTAHGKHLSKKIHSSLAEDHGGKENHLDANSAKNAKPSPVKKAKSLNMLDSQTKCKSADKERDVVEETGKEASGPNKFRLLLKKIASVHIFELIHQQKLAFWINI